MRHETNYSSVNLFYNGGWALIDSEGAPPFWEISGASLEEGPSTYEVKPDGLSLQLSGQTQVLISQAFTESAGPLDFSGDLNPGDYRGMPNGYVHASARNLSARDLWTVSFDLRREVGTCTLRVSATVGGSTTYLTASTGGTDVTVSEADLARPHFYLDAATDESISKFTVEVVSPTPSVVSLDRMQLSLGRYADQPYTGDPFVEIFPKDCIVMTLGSACPAGFEKLGDGELEVPPDWEDAEPGIKAREGNYPYSGTELGGSPVHGPETDTTSLGTNSVESFESRFGRAYQEQTVGPAEWEDPSNNPLVDQQLNHTHTVGTASSRVLSVEYLFCKRV